MSDIPSKRRSKRPSSGTGQSVPTAALDTLLSSDGSGNPIRRALWLDTLDRRLHPLLPPALAAHARLANVDGGKLIYLVDSPIWHARLRLAAHDLIDAARSIGLDVSTVAIRVATQPWDPSTRAMAAAKPDRNAAGLSAVAGQALRDALELLRPKETDGRDT
ncbi:DciA family protein [Luteimonas sp. RIT-PG2_3]